MSALVSSETAAWLADTLIWTGVLIALVLVLRRPVSRVFGAQAAYALWLLPFLRLILPPITLPAAMAPAAEPSAAPVAAATDAELAAFLTETTAAQPAAIPFDWTGVVVALWLAVAGAFLVWRVVQYSQMRTMLLEEAVPVGEEGNIRFVETPEVPAPVAFGLRDRVVALPPRFMHLGDRKARDLAIAHELAHHRGGDILANFAAQLLLAMHWFNPIAWVGWRAMRRDQEAACDARVMAGRPVEERADYGQVIASFAAGPHLALAAPMACPVLGEKSIIHRLRSLNMNNTSRRRRITSRILLGGAALALPLTASISYAEVPAPPAPPSAPAAVAAPVALVAPVNLAAPLPPEAPEAPEAPQDVNVEVSVDEDGTERRVNTWVVKNEDGKKHEVRRMIAINEAEMSKEEMAEAMEAVREAMKEVDIVRIEAEVQRELAEVRMKDAHKEAKILRMKCDSRGGSVFVDEDSKDIEVVCSSEIRDEAVSGLKEARKAIANDDSIPKDMRKEILHTLDHKIRELSAKG
ncbi:M56 family metallopeptidase [Altererythrobacter sp. ZODW24]|uniref:M56 family metallopeptidase n=1 Tax=Altererythrobacter sp. ZODW24 TaxID=2185142 RepID=UPI000DF86092|nr:M56 family metallopeptidase [Altererythrobacter sp. ZODW24]